jgi:probable phosphoglycerate mutase
MSETIVLVQHCQSEHHLNDLTGGWTDTDLTEKGRRQAEVLASRLAREIGDREVSLWCSDLKRAHQTAEAIAAALEVEAMCAPGLREFNAGEATGKTVAWARQHQAPLPEAGYGVDRQPFPGAETLRQFFERVSGCVKDLVACSSGLPVMVSHGGATRVAVCWWLGVSPEQFDGLDLATPPGSVSILSVNERRQHVLRKLGDVSHLVEAGLTDREPLVGTSSQATSCRLGELRSPPR